MNRRGFSILELMVVVSVFVVVLGAALYQYQNDRVRQEKDISRVDKQAAIRRFLMWFRQDMLSMGKILNFRVMNTFDPELDSRLIEVEFETFTAENTLEVVNYRFEPGVSTLYRSLNGKQIASLSNIANIQIFAHDYSREVIRDVSALDNTWYFSVRLVFVSSGGNQKSFDELRQEIFPRIKSSANKAGFNRFNLSSRF